MKQWMGDLGRGALHGMAGNWLTWLIGAVFVAVAGLVPGLADWLMRGLGSSLPIGVLLLALLAAAGVRLVAARHLPKPHGERTQDNPDNRLANGPPDSSGGGDGALQIMERALDEQARELAQLREDGRMDRAYIKILEGKLAAKGIPLPQRPMAAPKSVVPPSPH